MNYESRNSRRHDLPFKTSLLNLKNVFPLLTSRFFINDVFNGIEKERYTHCFVILSYQHFTLGHIEDN